MNAYVGNHPGARGGSFPSITPVISQQVAANEAETDRELLRQAIDFVVSNPGEAISILPRKLMNLYLLETEAVTSLFQGENPSPAWMKYTLDGISQLFYVFFLIAFCIRALDLVTAGQRPRGVHWTGWILAAYFTVICLVLHGEDRYRLPILPWILIERSVLLVRMAAEAARDGALSSVRA